MNLSVVEAPGEINKINSAFEQFNLRNSSIQKNAKMLPDSLLAKYGRIQK
jgi:hypothetical protein